MNILKKTGKRALAFLLSLALVLSVPILPSQTAQAAVNWLTPYLDKMTSWGVVKGDGTGDYRTESTITRAEFVAMMNRAYGYTDMGPIPFTDVYRGDWFYEDICKAYTAGIFHGTSETTASPYAPITREQAITLIARNMRMDEIPGEIIDFSDGRLFSPFSRGYVQSAILAGILNGYDDGTAQPLRNVTRGEAMKMMCVGIGNLINTPGTHAPGGVFGNLTINCTNVTLKDTIITGDLYISGGISLGDVVLENVQVRGRIVVAGGGSSELGQNSVMLRGVDTKKLIVDAPTGQYVSVRTEGRTHIQDGAFRSDAFLDDGCRDGYGILNVSLEGDPGDSFTLTGNLETVVNRTPDSTLLLGDAQASSVTVDEKATGSKLVLEVNASADEVNLDVGTAVEGSGDIGQLNINAAGSTTTMLPDKLYIRPGLEANISGDDMDASEAQQYSEEPRILNGYPKIKNVAPTTADGIHQTNKKGVVYWGLTTAAIGAVPDTEEGREKLMNPSYGSGFLLSGNYEVETKETDFAIPEGLKGLTASGTYFISALLVDSRGHVSPVYSERFETPDDIVPAFSSRDYPYMSSIEVDDPEVTVMANKACDMYYALFPQGSTQPTVNDFLSFAGFDDALGYGRVHLNKNKTWTEQVNKIIYPEAMNRDDFYTGDLKEQGTYDLYLWLADADGIKSSAITKLTFTTRDKTPPQFTTDMQQTTMGATNIGANCVINEPGTVYWAIVNTGTEYPKLPKNWEQTYETLEKFMQSEEAKFQLANGQNALKAGSVNTNGNVNVAVSVTGLEKEKAYDLYYIAVDKAGNYSDIVKKITVYTEDSTPPTATLDFTRKAPGSEGDIPQPYADSDVKVIFSENILDSKTGDEPLELYQTANSALATEAEKTTAVKRLKEFLERSVQLYQKVGSSNTQVKINYENVDFKGENDISLEMGRDGKLTITFPGSLLNLGSGSTYYFQFANITDASPKKNEMRPRDEMTPPFTTVSALAIMNEITATTINPKSDNKPIDIGFSITPESTNNSDPGTYWDMMMWLDTTSTFDLYRRVRDKDSPAGDDDTWQKIGTKRLLISTGQVAGTSLVVMKKGGTNTLPFLLSGPGSKEEYLEEGKIYEYALYFSEMNGNTNRDAFNGRITCEMNVIIGTQNNVSSAFIELNKDKLNEAIKAGSIKDITSPQAFSITKPFSDQTAPELTNSQPTFTPGDSGVSITLALKDNRIGRVHYLITPENVFDPLNGDTSIGKNWDPYTSPFPSNERDDHKFTNLTGTGAPTTNRVTRPIVDQVVQPGATLGEISDQIVYGVANNVGSASMTVDINGLMPNQVYYAYFVTQGSSNQYSDIIYIYKFKTLPVTRPVLTLQQEGSIVKVLTSLPSTTDINYIIVPYSDQMGSDLYKYLDAKGEATDTGTKDQKRIFELMDLPADISSEGSQFDKNAATSLKRTLSNYIRSQSANSQAILGFGKGTATSAKELAIDLTNPKFDLKYETDYCVVAVGRSALSNPDNPESYAFRATFPVRLQDTEAPKVTSAITYTSSITTDGKFTGTVTLNFDKTLYCTTSSSGALSTLKTITTGTKDFAGKDEKDSYISADSTKVISARSPDGTTASAPGIYAYTNSSREPASTTTITLSFTSVSNNGSATFTSTLCNASRATRSPALNVVIKVSKDRNGDWVATAEIPAAWKAPGFTMT